MHEDKICESLECEPRKLWYKLNTVFYKLPEKENYIYCLKWHDRFKDPLEMCIEICLVGNWIYKVKCLCEFCLDEFHKHCKIRFQIITYYVFFSTFDNGNIHLYFIFKFLLLNDFLPSEL
jgi:hypothetical protein